MQVASIVGRHEGRTAACQWCNNELAYDVEAAVRSRCGSTGAAIDLKGGEADCEVAAYFSRHSAEAAFQKACDREATNSVRYGASRRSSASPSEMRRPRPDAPSSSGLRDRRRRSVLNALV